MRIKDLTKRELEILKLTAQGHTSLEIGKLSGTKAGTVRNQKGLIYIKLRAKSSAHAIAIAKDRGII